MTVVDPRHPLYDQTFPLLYLTHAHQMVRCAVVQLAPDVTRLIPLAATDRAAVPPVVFSVHADEHTRSRIAHASEDRSGALCPAGLHLCAPVLGQASGPEPRESGL